MSSKALYQYASKDKLEQMETEFNSEKRLTLKISKAVGSNIESLTCKFDCSYMRQLIDDLIFHPALFTFNVCPSTITIEAFVSIEIHQFEYDILNLYREFIKII